MSNEDAIVKAGMVDISAKEETKRRAVAAAVLTMSSDAFTKLMNDECPKGNVWETARVAGIMAAKSTPAVIPMCHPLMLNKVFISFEKDVATTSVRIQAEVVCCGRTGVEMEAMTAVSISALTIYDMMKWADKGMILSEVKLLAKSGGKSGDYTRVA